ncbi:MULTISPECIES: MFS transporter [Bacillus]|uniref:MFS transporter n=1 Tax=Bacillus TaxID=1386 RepID=UPI000F771460|nr:MULTISPECIES: MFS transporter [Bacillus]MDJ0287735.1 MFS transporter [Bacillus altitudinis]
MKASYKELLLNWKQPSLLLSGIGISNLGDWIYLIALNLIVLNMTDSATAVAGLYIIKPIAAILTTFWAGSIVDRFPKRQLMIILDVLRALFVVIIPLVDSLWLIYILVLLISMASSFFEPTSATYITKFIPQNQRKRFNSLRSLVSSGAFVLGPALAGLLFIIGNPTFAIYTNSFTFLFSAFIICLLPKLENEKVKSVEEKISFKILQKDWKLVIDYARKEKYVMLVYLLFQSAMVVCMALDSQEVVFTREVLHLSESSYGVLVSIAGVGILAGSLINAVTVKWLSSQFLIGAGTTLVACGYLIYSFSTTFIGGAVGFFVLAFFLGFANTGFWTFYQNNIPVNVMGRVGSVLGMFLAILQIGFTFLIGFTGDFISVKYVVIFGSSTMLVIALVLLLISLMPSKVSYYNSGNSVKSEIT